MNLDTCKLCPHSKMRCASMVLNPKNAGRQCVKVNKLCRDIEVCPLIAEELNKK